MKDSPDINDTLRMQGADAVRERSDKARRYGPIDQLPPLTISEWMSRDLPPPDWLMGHWLSTTTRVLMVAPTGLGKSNLGMAIAMHVAGGVDFLHWEVPSARRALFVDGEMSRRLLKQRIADTASRLGQEPRTFFALSREDIENFAPINTAAGQAQIEKIIEEIGGADLIVFDAIMSLTLGDMKEGAAWASTMPWVRSLTKKSIGQIWVHHTGHDESKSYGDKSREWEMDCVLHLDQVKREDTDVSFQIEFRKARDRTPATRADFADARIVLLGDQWISDTKKASKKINLSPLAKKFLDALCNVLAGGGTLINGRCCASTEQWRTECGRLGLIDQDKPKSASALFSKYRRELVAANSIACDDDWSWLIQ